MTQPSHQLQGDIQDKPAVPPKVRRVLDLLAYNPDFIKAVELLSDNNGFGEICLTYSRGFRLHEVGINIKMIAG